MNELSACTRVRQNFLDKVSRFWELQGITLRIPRIENEVLCLYTLHRCISKHGGFSKCCQEGSKFDGNLDKNFSIKVISLLKLIFLTQSRIKNGVKSRQNSATRTKLVPPAPSDSITKNTSILSTW